MLMMAPGAAGSRVARSVGAGRAVPIRVLPGPLRPPRKGLAGGTCFVPLLFVVLALALLRLPQALVLPRFTSPALLGVAVGAALTARAQEKGYKDAPLFLYTDTKVGADVIFYIRALCGSTAPRAR